MHHTRGRSVAVYCLATVLTAILLPGRASAQITMPSFSTDAPAPQRVAPGLAPLFAPEAALGAQSGDAGRACDGCPQRHVGKAFLTELYVNIGYGMVNIVRGQVTGRITPKSWWENMKRGWEFDLDDFEVNQFGHPYQGNNYFNSGRAHGLTFWESAALTAFGSGTWEYFGETNRASVNDLINTTMGGIALGEMFHRTAWMIRDPRGTSGHKRRKELIAMAIDPVTSLTRLVSGDASRNSEPPVDAVPASLGYVVSAGVLYRDDNALEESTTNPYMEMLLDYGESVVDVERPFDRFQVRFDFGGGAGLSEIKVRGDLFGKGFLDNKLRASVVQGYQYNNNTAYRYGGQSVLGLLESRRALGSTWSMMLNGGGGFTVLGSVDSLPPGQLTPTEPDPNQPSAGQGVSTGPRNYDYGPGSIIGANFNVYRHNHPVLTMSYDGFHLFTTDGIRANHFLQRARAIVTLPLRGRLGASLITEYFDRRTYYRTDDEDGRFNFPQFRAAVTWSGR